MSLIYQSKELVGGKRPGLYIGKKKDAKNLEKLRQWNITHILNMTPEKDVNVKVKTALLAFVVAILLVSHLLHFVLLSETTQAGVPNYFEKKAAPAFLYKRIAVYDSPTSATSILDSADDIVSFISKGLLHGGVLVHCQQGVSRSTTAAAMYLIR